MPDELRVTPPRARILAAARDLFHRRGLRGVGVDAIAEAAGTNKMTLYRHFESKDELIVAYLRGVAAEADAINRGTHRDRGGDAGIQRRCDTEHDANPSASRPRGNPRSAAQAPG